MNNKEITAEIINRICDALFDQTLAPLGENDETFERGGYVLVRAEDGLDEIMMHLYVIDNEISFYWMPEISPLDMGECGIVSFLQGVMHAVDRNSELVGYDVKKCTACFIINEYGTEE